MNINKIKGNYDRYICYTIMIWMLIDAGKMKGSIIPMLFFIPILIILYKLNS